MLQKQYRLKNKSAFNAVYKQRNSAHKDGVTLWIGYKKNSPETVTTVGFVVSKKTHKRAVKRNRLKRLMRESYRLLMKEGKLYNSQEYMSLIFTGHEAALEKNFAEIKSAVEYLLREIKDTKQDDKTLRR